MRHHTLIRLPFIVAALAAFTASHLYAGAKFSGSTGYEIVNDSRSVQLKADFVQNTSAENATGTLMLKLWALDAPYKGGNLSGVLLGSYKLDGLKGGQHYPGIAKTVPLTMPSAKRNYVICLTLSEYKNGGYGIIDWRNMPQQKLLGPLPLFTLEGPWSWHYSYEGGTLDMTVAKISHRRTAHTGTLKLSVWATRQPYSGGKLSGFEVGEVQKKALEPGYSYTNVKNTGKFTPPPNGTYYLSLVLTEFRDGGYVIVATIPSSKPTTFSGGKN
jgi:hypothetical protein